MFGHEIHDSLNKLLLAMERATKARNIPCTGVGPAASTAAAARAKGIPIVEGFSVSRGLKCWPPLDTRPT